MIRVQTEPFDGPAEIRSLMELAPAAGAVASFIGLVRGEANGLPVLALELERHPTLTAVTIESIGDDACARFRLISLSIIHRHGRLLPEEGIVFVGAAAGHRRNAFDAVDYVMDRLKIEAPFWKREEGPGSSRWIEPRLSDLADHGRWNPLERQDAQL